MTLWRFLRNGKIEEATAFLQSLDPGQRAREIDYALFVECNREDFQMTVIEWLVANGADVNARFNNSSVAGAAIAAVTERTFGLIDYLVLHGVVPEKSSDVIHEALEGRITEGAYDADDSPFYQNVLLHLMKYHFDLNYTDEMGRTALHYAADSYVAKSDRNLACDLLPILLANGARTDIKDNNGETPANIAARKGDSRTLQLLESFPS